jgi:hypothetical protein
VEKTDPSISDCAARLRVYIHVHHRERMGFSTL